MRTKTKSSQLPAPSSREISTAKHQYASGGCLKLAVGGFSGAWSLVLGALLVVPASAQSLWHDETAKPMFADKRASSAGDILTILVQETTSAAKDNKSATSKDNSLDASISTFLYGPSSGAAAILAKGGNMPAIKYGSKNSFSGSGSVNNSQKIVASVAVKVLDVLPNKNLVIEGRRETSFGGEHQVVILHGIVRSEDVAANNTVYSYNIADAKVEINSKGSIDDVQRKGWFTKIWDKVTPF